MATQADLNDDLSVGMTEIRRTLEHYNLGEWREYLLVRCAGRPESFVVLTKEADTSDFADRLVAFHKEQSRRERMEAEGVTEEDIEESRMPKTWQDSER